MDGMGFLGGAMELWGREEILYFVSESISSIADQFRVNLSAITLSQKFACGADSSVWWEI